MATMNESTLREEITRVGQSLYARGYTVGMAGNISVRPLDGWPIIPIDACLSTLGPARITKALATGEWVNGDKPSKALALHCDIYDRNAEVHTVVYMRSTYLVVPMLADVWHEVNVLPSIMSYYVTKVGHVSFIVYRRPGYPDMVARITALANDVRAMLLGRLRPVVWYGLVSTTVYTLEESEEIARFWLMTKLKPVPLSDAQIDELRQTFGARWQSNRWQIDSTYRSVHITLILGTK